MGNRFLMKDLSWLELDPPSKRLKELSRNLLRLQDMEMERLRADPSLVDEIRNKYHPRGTCKIHGRRYVPHPLAVRCFHPACVSLILVNSAARQCRLRQARKIQRQGYWDDFVQFAALDKLCWIRKYPLLPDLFNFAQAASMFCRRAVRVPSLIGQQDTYEITDDYTITQLIESEAEEMINSCDNTLTLVAFRQARERFGNDTHLLAMGGVLDSMDVARLEIPASNKGQQIDYYLHLADVFALERAWLTQQLSDYEVPYAEEAARAEPFRTTVPDTD